MAVGAEAAPGREIEHDARTDGDPDAGPDLLDDRRALVPEHGGKRERPLARRLSHVAVADTGREDPHAHFARPRSPQLHLLDALRLAEGAQDGCSGRGRGHRGSLMR